MELKSIHKEQTYLLAVSGGIDSMVMADLFLKQNVQFAIAHCNFSLRAHESDLDEELVKSWCTKHGIICHSKKFDTKEYANINHVSIQEAARTLRYSYFNELLQLHNLNFIATGHHQDDSTETLLFHFFRGTGIQGLQGIPAKNDLIIRPLIHCSKEEIIEYAKTHRIYYRQDASNEKNEYTRNNIRNQIIPLLEKSFPTVKQNLANNLSRFKDVHEIYHQAIALKLKKLVEQRGKDYYIPILKLKNAATPETLLYEFLKPFHYSFEQSKEVLQLMERQTGSFVESETHKSFRNRNFIIVTEKNTIQSECIVIERNDKLVETIDFKLKLEAKDSNEFWISKEPSIANINADLLVYPLLLRKWRQGDYLYPLGMLKKKKVARILIDSKIDLNAKEHVWVIESDKKIVWIVGLRIDHRFRIQEKTKQIVQLSVSSKL